MKYALFVLMITMAMPACENRPNLINNTRPGGYAMGENVPLRFSLTRIKNPPDSIEAQVIEKKTGYIYAIWADRGDCDDTCRYSCIWDGRKLDGRWPSGGHYLVYAIAEIEPAIFSDTVEIGLAD